MQCKSIDISSFIMDSEVVYSRIYDFMFKVLEIKIIKHGDKLYTVNSVDGDRWIEPLFLQVGDDGSLIEYFFTEFVKGSKIDLSEYFINYIDYAEMMEMVRVKSGLILNKEDSELQEDLVEKFISDEEELNPSPFRKSNLW